MVDILILYLSILMMCYFILILHISAMFLHDVIIYNDEKNVMCDSMM